MGNRLRTTYYTRKVALVEPATNTIPGTDNLQDYNIVSYIMLGNKRYVRYNHGSWALEYVYNPEGYIRYYGPGEHYSFYYIKDHLGNIRDYATINQLICLSNMENLNAVFINEGMPQGERLQKLNQIAIQQMTVLEQASNRNLLKG